MSAGGDGPVTDGAVTILARGEGLAAWRQIADGLSADIEAGHLAPGSQLPTEAALCSLCHAG